MSVAAGRRRAQEEALVGLVRSRRLLDPAALALAESARGEGQPLAQVLTRRGLLTTADLGRLLADLQGQTFVCRCRSWRYADLAPLPALACPACGDGLRAGDAGAAGAAGAPAVGRAFGPYELVRELGRGAMGVVFLGRVGPDGPPVAIKLILDDGQDDEARARFQREASIAMRLDHPGIVRALDVGRVAGRAYYAMEYVPGRTLAQRLAEGPLAPREAARLVADVARAVHAAHERGVVHRDLKPANIILADPDGRPRITDFGLARDDALHRSLTRTGAWLGTPTTMSPEQLRGEKGIDGRADVYALGAVLYRCLTGRFPHEAASPVELAQAVLNEVPVLPSSRRAGVPAALDEVVLRALAKEREARYPDAAALADALEGWLAARPRRAGAGGTASRGRSPVAVAAAVLLVGGAGVGGAVVAWGLRARGAAPAPAPAAPDPPVAAAPTPAASDPPVAAAPTPAASDPPVAAAPTPAASDPPVAAAPVPAPPASRAAGRERADPALEAAERDLLDLLRGRVDDEARAEEVVTRCLALDGGPRALALRALALLLAGDRRVTFDARRWLVLAAPDLTDDGRAVAALMCYELGFHRAAVDLAAAAVVEGRLRSAWAGYVLVALLLKVAPPVADPARAVSLGGALLEAHAREDAPDLPRSLVLRLVATAQVLAGDRPAAAASLRAAVAAEPEPAERARIQAQAERVARGEVDLAAAWQSVALNLPAGRLLERLGEPELRLTSDAAVAQELRGLAERGPRGGRRGRWGPGGRHDHEEGERRDRTDGPPPFEGPGGRPPELSPMTAVTLLRAARAWGRAGDPARALEDLERAAALTYLDEDLDVRQLVLLELARALEAGAPPAGRLAEVADAAARTVRPDIDLRTAGEVADAAVVQARALRREGRREEARAALARAEAAAPRDRRELEAARAASRDR